VDLIVAGNGERPRCWGWPSPTRSSRTQPKSSR